MASEGLADGLFSAFLNWLYQSGDINVPKDYHSRNDFIMNMISGDSSSVINTLLDYGINSASTTEYKVESKSKVLEKLLTIWLDEININVNGVPTGLQQLSKEYFRERWKGSSLCLLRVSNWEDITIDKVTIKVPTILWFVNGASVYIKRPTEKNYTLGSDKYYLDEGFKNELTNTKDSQIIIQKPFARWFEKYPVPYLVMKGVLKNYLTLKNLQEKVDEIISKVLPYLFVISKGTESMAQAGISYSDPELTEFLEQFKHVLEKYKIERGRVPANAVPFGSIVRTRPFCARGESIARRQNAEGETGSIPHAPTS